MENRQRWERVLNAVETDARRAEALLAQVQRDSAEEAGVEQALAIPAEWQLPTATDTARAPEGVDPVEAYLTTPASELPAIEDMPPVPAELRDRIVGLQTHIRELQSELEQALREWQPVAQQAPMRPVPPRPQYVDRQL